MHAAIPSSQLMIATGVPVATTARQHQTATITRNLTPFPQLFSFFIFSTSTSETEEREQSIGAKLPERDHAFQSPHDRIRKRILEGKGTKWLGKHVMQHHDVYLNVVLDFGEEIGC